MTISIYRTADAWWAGSPDTVAKIDTEATRTAQLLADRPTIDRAAASTETVPVSSLELLSPVTAPCRVVAQMTNFASHVEDTGGDPKKVPLTFFRKASGSIAGPVDDIVKPAHVRLLDYEVEIGLVIGRHIPVGTAITADNLADYICGLVVTNDVSARDVQLAKTQFYEAKSYPTFTPVGPALVLLDADELGRFSELRLQLRVNGELRQDSTVDGDMIYRPVQALAALARFQEVSAGDLVIESAGHASESWPCDIGVLIAENLHPVSNPAVDAFGNIYTTFSGSRGQKVPVAVYKIDLNLAMKPFLAEMMNATGLAFDDRGTLYISSRYDGFVHQVTPAGAMSVYVEGMGVATGIAFDHERNLYVGDRSGTIFKIGADRQIFVFATLEPSMAAYHLAFGPDGYLYVTGPTTSSFDCVHRISDHGEVEVFYRGLGRPQGMAFDVDGNLYAAASIGGRRGVVRIGQDRKAELFLSGPGIVGLAFAPSRALIVATTNALYRVDVGIKGRPLL